MTRTVPRLRRDENGAFMVLYALLVVGMFAMAAVVVDLGAMREDKRRSRSVADIAATAAAGRLNTTGTPLSVCVEGWRYAALNLGLTTVPASPCAGNFSSGTCDPLVEQSASGTIEGRTVTITYPVRDTSPLMEAEVSGGAIEQTASAQDGTPCSRVGVAVSNTQDTFFGGVIGIFDQTAATHSVARGISQTDGGENVPVLVVLENTRCIALDARSATIEAFGTDGSPGIIRVDSNGTHGSCGTTIDVQGSGRIIVHPGSTGVPGVVTHYALQPRGYEPADVTAGRINVTPSRVATPLGRDLWDQKYHCGSSTRGCVATNSNPSAIDHILKLEQAYGGTGTPTPAYDLGDTFGSFKVYPTDPLVSGQGATCGRLDATVVVPTGNWYVDCPATLDLRGTLTFQGGNVVWRNGVDLRGNLTFNGLATATNADSFVYFRAGNVVKMTAASTMEFNRTFIYIASGMLEATAGGVIRWTAPDSGPFEKMALWSESTSTHKLWGGADMVIKGIFFMPNAAFEMGGNPSTDALDVQFVAKTAYTQGAAHLKLRGNPDYGIATDTTTTRLIR